MNERIDQLLWQAGGFNKISNPNDSFLDGKYVLSQEQLDMFAELLIAEVLDEVAERAYYNGDRNWCEELDRPWVELEFGIGKLAELKK